MRALPFFAVDKRNEMVKVYRGRVACPRKIEMGALLLSRQQQEHANVIATPIPAHPAGAM